MNIDFYFDPSCPFCWITSRWLLLVKRERDMNITWKPFSLVLKNDELEEDKTKHSKGHRASHRVLRVILAANETADASLIDLYTAIGYNKHLKNVEFDDISIKDMLLEHDLPKDLLRYADLTEYDTQLQNYIDEAVNISGKDIGVPFIVLEDKNGTKQGFFGPVLQELPSPQGALELWDGLSKLATNSSFYELKRSRPEGLPNVQSTKVV